MLKNTASPWFKRLLIDSATVRPLLIVLVSLLPTALFVALRAVPGFDRTILVPLEHFVVTSNVALVAAAVALLVARGALQLRHYPSVLVAAGFAAMAGVFTVHALATPGVLYTGDAEAAAGAVAGLSAQLALFLPAVFFALRSSSLGERLARSWLSGGRLLAVTVAGVVAYGTFALARPDLVWWLVNAMSGTSTAYPAYVAPSPAPVVVPQPSGAPVCLDANTYVVACTQSGAQAYGVTPSLIGLAAFLMYLFASWRLTTEFVAHKRALQGALAISCVLLSQAQISQLFGPTWTLSWWEYHGLMLAAVVLAIGAMFVELDRRRGLERFLPPNVVDRVLTGDALRLAGERVTVTILFADIRGSTALAERLGAEEIVAVLNAYLRTMASAVIAEGGILDKFLGDGLMAIFGALGDPTQGAAAAARAALRIRTTVEALSAERGAKGEPVVRFGVGIHTGEVVLGAVGLPERSDYTAIGDTVNTASRMETLTKEFQVDAVLSDATARLLQGDGTLLRPLGDAQVRGKERAIPVFTLS